MSKEHKHFHFFYGSYNAQNTYMYMNDTQLLNFRICLNITKTAFSFSKCFTKIKIKELMAKSISNHIDFPFVSR